MTDRLDITIHGFCRDHLTTDRLDGNEAITVKQGITRRAIVDPLGWVAPISHRSVSRDVAAWELQGLIDRQTLRQRLEAIPEARRRALLHEAATRQRSSNGPCPSCGGSRWIDDDAEGRGYECPACR